MIQLINASIPAWVPTCAALRAPLLEALFAVLMAYNVVHLIYNLFISPLRSYPGPKLWAVTKIPFNYHTLRGTSTRRLTELHDKYGPAVRYAPNAVAFTYPDAWDEIYGPFVGGKKHMEMDQDIFGGGVTVTGAVQITNAIHADHRRLRRRFLPAVSARAVASQESVLFNFAKQFVSGICAEINLSTGKKDGVIDIAKWFSMATFDVISDLTFGKPFHCLESMKIHPWITIVFGAFKALPFLRVIREVPGMIWLGNHAKYFLPKRLKRMWEKHFEYAFELVEERIKNPGGREDVKDFIYYIFEGGDGDLTRDEIKESAAQMVMAGSEPTATFLAGVCYLLAQNPHVYAKLKHEIRSSFTSTNDMTLAKLATLPYLQAVIREGLRIFPPAADIFPRVIPEGGEVIFGKWLPENTRVGIVAFAASRSESNFPNANTFIPERWIGGAEKDDRRMRASQPFGQGHRSCIGKLLAYAEMRLLLAHVVWYFDMQLRDEDKHWMDECRVFLGWEKRPLRMRLTMREGVA